MDYRFISILFVFPQFLPKISPLKIFSKSSNKTADGVTRIFMDGAFDLTHYGHFNALRLGRELGNYLVVGVNSSESVLENKGFAPVLTDEERQIVIEGCRWVDEIVPCSPFVMTKE